MSLAIRVSNLTRYYGVFKAVDNLSFEVPLNSCFGLLGPNGAGKSTTIKMITGTIRPTSGTIEIMGYPAGSIAANSHMGYLPERFGFDEKWLVIDFLTYIGELYGLKKSLVEERALELLDWIGLAGWETEEMGALSAGMKQRVGIVQALISDPDILILDEPATNLDAVGRTDILKKIRELVDKKGKTVVISSHILLEVEKVADHIAIINRGRSIAYGALSELKKKVGLIHIEVDKPKELLEILEDSNLVEELSQSNNTIIVKARDPLAFERFVLKTVLERNLQLYYYSSKGANLEELFLGMISGGAQK
ncbi:MAG: ABC transporter ATP-binding protein [Candidatus Asgardarchaeia archaeon]